jgi:hypothetical protein
MTPHPFDGNFGVARARIRWGCGDFVNVKLVPKALRVQTWPRPGES